MSRDKIEVGYFVSIDQPTGYGRDSNYCRFQGGTIYNDAASSLVWVENQFYLEINENVMGKSRFEQWLWYQASDESPHYHGDNIIFTTIEY